MELTEELLAKNGIHKIHSEVNPNRYHCEITDTTIKIFPHDTLKDVFEMIFQTGLNVGIEVGKAKKIKEIKSVLNIT